MIANVGNLCSLRMELSLAVHLGLGARGFLDGEVVAGGYYRIRDGALLVFLFFVVSRACCTALVSRPFDLEGCKIKITSFPMELLQSEFLTTVFIP
jgi:hypothetical protein